MTCELDRRAFSEEAWEARKADLVRHREDYKDGLSHAEMRGLMEDIGPLEERFEEVDRTIRHSYINLADYFNVCAPVEYLN